MGYLGKLVQILCPILNALCCLGKAELGVLRWVSSGVGGIPGEESLPSLPGIALHPNLVVLGMVCSSSCSGQGLLCSSKTQLLELDCFELCLGGGWRNWLPD